MVLKTGPDRLARSIQLGTEHQSGPIKLIKTDHQGQTIS